jgi:hypothetical protein
MDGQQNVCDLLGRRPGPADARRRTSIRLGADGGRGSRRDLVSLPEAGRAAAPVSVLRVFPDPMATVANGLPEPEWLAGGRRPRLASTHAHSRGPQAVAGHDGTSADNSGGGNHAADDGCVRATRFADDSRASGEVTRHNVDAAIAPATVRVGAAAPTDVESQNGTRLKHL